MVGMVMAKWIAALVLAFGLGAATIYAWLASTPADAPVAEWLPSLAVQPPADVAATPSVRNSLHERATLAEIAALPDDADAAALGRHRTVADLAVERASRAINAGLDGVVASGREAAAIRAMAPESFVIVTPGVRPASAAGDDQKRIATPSAAIAAGADYLVVGRPIIARDDRRAAAEAIVAEMRPVFEAR